MAKQFFKDLPDTSTPITADRLNGLLDGEEAMGNLVVDSIRTKNMLDINNIENGYSYSYGTSGSVPTPTANNNRASISVINAIKVKPNTTYTFNSTSTTFRFAIGQMTNEKISLGDTGWVTSFPYTITTSSTCEYLGFNFSKKDNSTITTNDFNDFINSNLILEEGNTATEYFPYQELVTEDTGWVDVTLLNGATPRSGDQYKPQCRRIGNVVYLKGQIDIPAHNAGTIYLTLPDGFQPAYEVSMLGFYRDTWLDTSGNLTVNNDTTARTNQKLYAFFLIN